MVVAPMHECINVLSALQKENLGISKLEPPVDGEIDLIPVPNEDVTCFAVRYWCEANALQSATLLRVSYAPRTEQSIGQRRLRFTVARMETCARNRPGAHVRAGT
jgi:hypothetical protein